MRTYLDGQIDQIYLTEDIMKSLRQIKGKLPSLQKAMSNANLMQARTMLNKLPEASLEELSLAAKNKNKKDYAVALRMVKGDKGAGQKVFCILYTSLKGMRAAVKDPSIQASIDEVLEDVLDWAKSNWSRMAQEGFSLFIVMFFIAHIVSASPILFSLAQTGTLIGAGLMFWGIYLLLIKVILNTYFALKGKK